MTRLELEELARQLLGVASIFAPGHAAAVGALLGVATKLNDMLREIRDNDPEVWAKISKDYNAAVEAFNKPIE
jgi:hypothetical protein